MPIRGNTAYHVTIGPGGVFSIGNLGNNLKGLSFFHNHLAQLVRCETSPPPPSSRLPIAVIGGFVLATFILHHLPISPSRFVEWFPQFYFAACIIILSLIQPSSLHAIYSSRYLCNHLAFGGVASFIAIGGVYLMGTLSQWYAPPTPLPLPIDPYRWVFALLIAPVVEETFFRGILCRTLLGEMSPLAAIFFSAVIFMLTHLRFHVGALALGGVAGIMFYYSRSIIPGMLLHTVCNGLSLIIPFKFPALLDLLQ